MQYSNFQESQVKSFETHFSYCTVQTFYPTLVITNTIEIIDNSIPVIPLSVQLPLVKEGRTNSWSILFLGDKSHFHLVMKLPHHASAPVGASTYIYTYICNIRGDFVTNIFTYGV
eukprot:sb/3476721/